jgi:hypothetical protein
LCKKKKEKEKTRKPGPKKSGGGKKKVWAHLGHFRAKKKKKTKQNSMEREGGPAAAFPPPAPLLSPSRRRGSGLLTSLQALLESLASSACGENASTVPSSPLDAARGALCSAATTTREDASSLFVLALVSALIGALAYLSLLAMGRARR